MAAAKALPDGKAAARTSRNRAASRARRGFNGATRAPPQSGRALERVGQLGLGTDVVQPRHPEVEGSFPLPTRGDNVTRIRIVFDTDPRAVPVVVLYVQLGGVEQPKVLAAESGRPGLAWGDSDDPDVLAGGDVRAVAPAQLVAEIFAERLLDNVDPLDGSTGTT